MTRCLPNLMTAPYFQRRGFLNYITTAFALGVTLVLWRLHFYEKQDSQDQLPLNLNLDSKVHSEISKTFVVASLANDDSTWLNTHFPDWEIRRYVVNDNSAHLTVPKNKGREAMVYLTYIIDNYNHLPDLAVFIHAARYQWHNDDPLYDGIPMLQRLQIPYLISQGYANLRCVWTLGCPSELILDGAEIDSSLTTNIAYGKAFGELFQNSTLPPKIGVPCCAQFSVSRDAILQRPLSDYQHYRQWLLDTDLDDHVSGRVLEYSWHFIFGKEYVHCPVAGECYCKTFGLCNLDCGEEGRCGERWPFPPSSALPNGWPEVGWNGETRDGDVLEKMRHVAVLERELDQIS